jgi:hypothetical protein
MKKLILFTFAVFMSGMFNSAVAQTTDRNAIQYYVPPTQDGVNIFEPSFTTDVEFDGI